MPLTAVFEGVGFRKMSVKALFEADDTNGRQYLKKHGAVNLTASF